MDVDKHVVHDKKFVCEKNHVFEVEKVIGHREVGLQGAQYLVLWLGYPVEDASWQPWKNLKSCIQLVHDYHNRNSRMVSRRFPKHSQTHGMSLRKTSDNAAVESNLAIEGVVIEGLKNESRSISGPDSPSKQCLEHQVTENSLYEWEVEDILGHESLHHAKEGKKMHYMVKWIGLRDPIWTEENRVLAYDSKGDLQAYINKELPFGEMLGEGSNMRSLG